MLQTYSDFIGRLEAMHRDMKKTIDGLSADALDWVPGPDMNSLTVLVAHSLGVEKAMLHQTLGGETIQRDRDQEFKTAGVDAATLARQMDEVDARTRAVFERLTLDDLERAKGTRRDGTPITGAWALAHALDHTAQHLGHMEITRQLWEQIRANGSGQ